MAKELKRPLEFWNNLCRAVGEDANNVGTITLHRDTAFITTVTLTKFLTSEQDDQLDALTFEAADLAPLEVQRVEVTCG